MRILLISPWGNVSDGLVEYSERVIAEHSVKVFPWNYQRFSARFLLPLFRIVSFVRALGRSDVVHVQYIPGLYFWHVFWLYTTARLFGTPVVTTLHEKQVSSTPWVLRVCESFVLRLSEGFITHTSMHKHALPERVQSRTRVVSHPLPKHVLGDVQRVPGRILLAGFVNKWKGFDVAINAFARIVSVVPNAHMRVVGRFHDEDYGEELISLVQRLGLEDKVSFVSGFLPREQFAREFQEASLVVMPYRRCTMSGVLSHAVQANAPVVFSDLPAFREYSMDEGVYVPVDNVTAFAEEIQRLLTDPSHVEDTQAWQKRVRVEASDTHIAEKTIDVYNEVYG